MSSSVPTTSAEWRLLRRPSGRPSAEDVELVHANVSAPGAGQVVVRNEVFSLEPYMWGRMTDEGGYIAPFALGEAMSGHAVGTVVASKDPAIAPGALVLHEAGWREVAVLAAADVRVAPRIDLSPASWLGVLGLTGFTAYVGLLEIGRCRPGEVVFVSAAAGAVGSTVVQIARSMGCRVIASAGSKEKVDYLLDELGVDQAFSYRAGPVKKSLGNALAALGEDGVDVYFDNVAGEHLEAALRYMRLGGRIPLCGAISTLTGEGPAAPRNLLRAIWQRVRLEGFLVADHEIQRPGFERVMGDWIVRGVVRGVQTEIDGIAGAFAGFLDLLDGRTLGKVVVRA